MSKETFHYEQQRLENDLIALEPFDVSEFSLLEKIYLSNRTTKL